MGERRKRVRRRVDMWCKESERWIRILLCMARRCEAKRVMMARAKILERADGRGVCIIIASRAHIHDVDQSMS